MVTPAKFIHPNTFAKNLTAPGLYRASETNSHRGSTTHGPNIQINAAVTNGKEKCITP